MNSFIIYYKVKPDFEEVPEEMPINTFLEEYRSMSYFTLAGDDIPHLLNLIYANMQGDIFSPNGEARDFVMRQGLNHTSMSVGDIIYHQNKKKFYGVANIGFSEMHLTM